MDEAPVLPLHVDDERLAGVEPGTHLHARGVHAALAQHLGDDPAEHVVADAADHRGGHPQLDQVHRHVGGTAADGQQQLVGQHQLAGSGQVGDRRADVVGDDDAGTQDLAGSAHGRLVKKVCEWHGVRTAGRG
jgi:hypothetical protein